MGSIDYPAAQRAMSLEQVLALLGWSHNYRERGDLLSWCPLCGHGVGFDRCFRVRGERWVCYRCKRSGGALDLYQASLNRPVYEATKDLCRRLGVAVPYKPRNRTARRGV